jgi:hypothetical protein
MKSQIRALFLIIGYIVLVCRAEDEFEKKYGAYLYQEISTLHSPTAFNQVLSNGWYNLEIGWIEPISLTSNVKKCNTYMNPSFFINVTPFSSYYSALFNLRILKWLQFGAGYKRVLFHGTMTGFEQKPSLSEWRPIKVIRKIPEHWHIGGADIFHTNFMVHLPLSHFADFNLTLTIENWNVDASGLSYVYLFSKDILISSKDTTYQFRYELELRPGKQYCPVLGNDNLVAKNSDFNKNLILTGIRKIPFIKHLYINAYLGYWSNHPHIRRDDVLNSLLISADLHWDLILTDFN